MASGSKRVIYAALVGNGLIAVTKFAAAALTGSSAMLSEGIHSLVDTGNQGLLLHGMARSKRPPDSRHPFGHGKEVYFWSFVVAMLIFGLGAGISLYEGIEALRHPEPIENPVINYVVLGLAFAFEAVAWGIALREFNRIRGDTGWVDAVRREKDPTVFVVLFEDTAAMLGLLVAFAGILAAQLTGNPRWDGAASVAIAGILAATATWLAFETKALLIGESARDRTVREIRELAGEHAGIAHVNEVLTMHVGPEYVLVNLSVDFHDGIDSSEVEVSIARLDRSIKQRFPRVRRIFVEAEARRSRVADA